MQWHRYLFYQSSSELAGTLAENQSKPFVVLERTVRSNKVGSDFPQRQDLVQYSASSSSTPGPLTTQDSVQRLVILSTSHAYHSTQHIVSTSIIAELNSVSSLFFQFLKREERGISSFLGPLPNPYYTTGTMQGMILCYFVDPHRTNEETILWIAKWPVSQPSELSEFTPSPSDSQFYNWESL